MFQIKTFLYDYATLKWENNIPDFPVIHYVPCGS